MKAFGPGLEPTGCIVDRPAEFTIDTRGAGKGPLKLYAQVGCHWVLLGGCCWVPLSAGECRWVALGECCWVPWSTIEWVPLGAVGWMVFGAVGWVPLGAIGCH